MVMKVILYFITINILQFVFKVLSEECGLRPLEPSIGRSARIVGGTISTYGEFPWQAALYYKGNFQCAASIITNRWVVTAAHCIESDWDKMHVFFNLYDLRDGFNPSLPYRGEIEVVAVNPNFAFNDDDDIALIKVTGEIPFSANIQPICIARGNLNYVSQLVTVSGWGTNGSTDGPVSSILKKVDLPIISNDDCKMWLVLKGELRQYQNIDSRLLCAGYREGGKSSCYGDSGGPMVLRLTDNRFYLVGVVSGGYECGKPDIPSLYTRVDFHADWIDEQIKLYDDD